MELQKKVIYYQ